MNLNLGNAYLGVMDTKPRPNARGFVLAGGKGCVGDSHHSFILVDFKLSCSS
jgi:hypothetical protein